MLCAAAASWIITDGLRWLLSKDVSCAQGRRHCCCCPEFLTTLELGSFLPRLDFVFFLSESHYTALEITEVCLSQPRAYRRAGDVVIPNLIHQTQGLLCKVDVYLGDQFVMLSSSVDLFTPRWVLSWANS